MFWQTLRVSAFGKPKIDILYNFTHLRELVRILFANKKHATWACFSFCRENRIDVLGNRLFLPSANQKSKYYIICLLAQVGSNPVRKQKTRHLGVFFVWQREQDSNLRYVAVHNISNVAPSTTRTSLHHLPDYYIKTAIICQLFKVCFNWVKNSNLQKLYVFKTKK